VAEQVQNFEHHAKFVPAYHRVALPIFLINLVWCVYRVFRAFSVESVISLLVAIGLLILCFYARIFALTVQDRVIRLEMRLRLQKLLPEQLRPRIAEFQAGQLVALRFASDEELPELARKVLEGHLTDRTAIKKLVRNWQPDDLRA
jgi:hypothetical protein